MDSITELYLGSDIIIEDSIINKINQYAVEKKPFEACGLLAGYIERSIIVIKEVYFITNTDNSEKHFTMDIKELFEAQKDIRKKNLTLVGNWHSHPETRACLSAEDIRLAYDKSLIYGVLSLQDNISDFRFYTISI